jgi:hypothetical protein
MSREHFDSFDILLLTLLFPTLPVDAGAGPKKSWGFSKDPIDKIELMFYI